MNEKNKRLGMEIAIAIIALIVYNAVVFLLFDVKGEAYWSAYLFTIVAIIAQIAVPLLALQRRGELRDAFLGLPVFTVGILYLLIQVILGLLIMVIRPFPLPWAIVIQLLLLAAYAVLVISALLVKGHVEAVERRNSQRTVFMKIFRSDVEILAGKVTDPQVKKAVEHLAEQARYADPTSNEALGSIEHQISDQFFVLQGMIEEGKDAEVVIQAVRSLESLVKERSIRCKLLK